MPTITVGLMVRIMLVQFEVLRHGDQGFDGHPRPVVVASLWGSFTGLEQE